MTDKFSQELLDRIAQDAEIGKIAAAITTVGPKGRSNKYDVCKCPECGRDDKFEMPKKKNFGKCHACGYGKNNITIIQFVQDVKGCSFPEAVKLLANELNLTHLLPEEKPKKKSESKVATSETDYPEDAKVRDALFMDAVRAVIAENAGSVAFLKRKLSVGHARAKAILDQLVASGVLADDEGAKYRAVLIRNADDVDPTKPKKVDVTANREKPQPQQPKPTAVRKKASIKSNFRDRALEESGITNAMQRITIKDEIKGKPVEVKDFDRYQSGTLDYRKNWAVVNGVDMVMHYIGLDRKRMTYIPQKGNTAPKPMVRVRFENPSLHTYQNNTPKYKQPTGSGLHLWLPNKLISDYNTVGTRSGVLTIQEGEKKADRFCQIAPSVGIMGIHSLAGTHDALPREFEMLQQHFEFDTYIFFMDADLFELGSSSEKSVMSRPKAFASAAKKYRQHIHKFQTGQKRLNILLAHPTTNDQGIKGVDDLMESGLITDDEMRSAIDNGIKGYDHEYVKFYDLTTLEDAKIDAIWHVNSPTDFAEHYKDQIIALYGNESFKLGKHRHRFNEEGVLEFDQPLQPDETFYETYQKKDESWALNFSDTKLLTYLKNRGFYRYREPAAKSEETSFNFIKVENNTVVKIPHFDIRDYVLEFLDIEESNQVWIRDYFRRYHETYLGQRTFSLLPFLQPMVLKDGRDAKFFTFKTPDADNVSVWKVTEDTVETQSLQGTDTCVWKSSLIDYAPRYVGPLFQLKKITQELLQTADADWQKVYAQNMGRYIIELTEAGKQCEYLKFLYNSSNFFWEIEAAAIAERAAEIERTNTDIDIEQAEEIAKEELKDTEFYSVEQQFETQQHLIAKLTACGHLMRKYRNPAFDYWICGMEGNLVEDQMSEGRSGKSLFALMLAHVCNVAYVDGKKDLERDIYVWDKVTPQTHFVNIDDASKRVRVENFYSRQTASFGVRAMNKGEVLIPYDDAPVGYLTSNYNLLKNDGSTRDRWRVLAFSDFYSADRKPQDIHGHLFYWDWNDEQKELFYTLMADCCRAFFQTGGVEQGPSDRVDRRRWDQEVGKQFKDWFDRTFVVPSKNNGVAVRTGERISKLVAYGIRGPKDEIGNPTKPEPWSFLAQFPDQRKFIDDKKFKRKLWLCCLLDGLIINDGKDCTLKYLKEFHGLGYGGDDKYGGEECFTIIEPKTQNRSVLPI